VTSLTTSKNKRWVACGYSSGWITVWDLHKKILLQVIKSNHDPHGTLKTPSIIQLAFLGQSMSNIISLDNMVWRIQLFFSPLFGNSFQYNSCPSLLTFPP